MLPSPPRPAAGSLPGGDMTFARRRSSGTTSGWTDDHACHQPSGIRGEAGTMLSPAEPCPPAGRPGRAPAGPRPSTVGQAGRRPEHPSAGGPNRISAATPHAKRASPNIGGSRRTPAGRAGGRPEHQRATPHASRPSRESAGASEHQRVTPHASGPSRESAGASEHQRASRTSAGHAGRQWAEPGVGGPNQMPAGPRPGVRSQGCELCVWERSKLSS
jgi:hypothetical protein